MPPFVLICYIKGFYSNDVKSYIIYRKAYESQIEGKRSMDTAWFSSGKMKFQINDITQCDYYVHEEKFKQET